MARDPFKIAILASDKENTSHAVEVLNQAYGSVTPSEADCLVVLGGDGFMLHCLHQAMSLSKPLFGMNFGSIGFLMNTYKPDDLIERIQSAHAAQIFPLHMQVQKCNGGQREYFAFNEISLLRQLHLAAKVRISVDGQERLDQLICDGVLVATPVGSTAYNFSASGPILPITSNLLALTPISPFRPRRWRGALLPNDVTIVFDIHEPTLRPVSVTADYQEERDICSVRISQNQQQSVVLLFDSEQTLEARIIAEQFAV
jgi:NAD+ kinase